MARDGWSTGSGGNRLIIPDSATFRVNDFTCCAIVFADNISATRSIGGYGSGPRGFGLNCLGTSGLLSLAKHGVGDINSTTVSISATTWTAVMVRALHQGDVVFRSYDYTGVVTSQTITDSGNVNTPTASDVGRISVNNENGGAWVGDISEFGLYNGLMTDKSIHHSSICRIKYIDLA